jgi:aminomethyltransferase
MADSISRTPLFDWHVAHQARMVEFGGWMMPVQYASIVDEHHATRKGVGLFDISHMGRLKFTGSGAAAFLDRLLTRRVVGMGAGKIRYSLVTNESGGILDDVLVYHLSENHYLLVVNASNRPKIVGWVERHLPSAKDVQFADQTLETAMIAVQGPAALASVTNLVSAPLGEMEYYTGTSAKIVGVSGLASRTGYTGEDGCELIVPRDAALSVWEAVLNAGSARGAKPAGLGARDTLRLEAAMPLYGHELSEEIDPYRAGLSFAVNLSHDFIGRNALSRLKDAPDQPVRVGLALSGKRVPREHYAVLQGGASVGAVTSGTFSPTLEKPIAMAYVRRDVAAVGTDLAIDIRGKSEPAQVVELPFYRRSKSTSS